MSAERCRGNVFDDGTPPPVDPVVTSRVGITKATEMQRRWMVP